jgi:hypothetical protein
MDQNRGMAIKSGTTVEVTTASGDHVVMRALGSPQRGRDFPVVWVCTPEEYDRAQKEGGEPDGLPWPVDSMKELLTTY